MKSTTGKNATRPESGSIPVEHELLAADKTIDFSIWLESELEELECKHAAFTTRHSLSVDFSSDR
ncbi:MAG: hypothetical protein KDB27_08915 [Planctomycetales bacterium]|nr:hypothetical protein [Planctomycetales bacterium]